ncbi:MAG TPA: thrombospondin type 3 repeat-containing protein, partial [Gemmatimonadaceae bacterium]|nr:thrombospondin type 3 repeat-containing protein [Gemmatimonadaceae bacterium]
MALVALAVAACSDGTTTPAPRTLAPAAAAADVNPDLDGDVYNYVTWTAANPLGGTASGTITLPDGHTVGVDFRVVQSSGAAGTYFAALYDAGSGVQAVSNPSIGNLSVGNYWLGPNNEAPFKSTSVANGPSNATMIALTGDITDSYVLTFSEPVQDPIMDILSLGSTGNSAEYDFGRQVELLSQGTGFWGGGSSSLTLMNGQNLVGREGNGTVRFIGSMSTLSWTVPDGEVFHNFTVAIRGLANPNADFDGDGVPDAIDNCPTTANANQADADFDGIGDACDPVNDPTVDTDGDGLTNAQEHAIGTSPTNPDTDGDGFTDKVDAFPLDPSRHLPDTTPPVIAYTVTGDLGSDNWYTSNVHVAWSVTDPDTPVSAKDGCVDTDLTSNTTAEGVTLTCAATSGGGTAPSQSVTIKIDKTIPSVTGAVTSGRPGTNGWYTTPVGITWTPSAAGPSGQNLSSDCSEVTTGETAGHTFTCT